MVCKNSFPSVPLPTHSSYQVPSSEALQPLLGSSPGLLIPPVRGSKLRAGRPLAAIFPSTQAGLRTGYFRRPPSAVQDLSGNPPEQFSEPLGALWSSFGHSLVPSGAVSDSSEAFCVARSAENLRKPIIARVQYPQTGFLNPLWFPRSSACPSSAGWHDRLEHDNMMYAHVKFTRKLV